MERPPRRGRFALAALAAGIVINITDGILYGVMLAAETEATLTAMGLAPPAGAWLGLYVAWAFVIGALLVWLYIGVRERLGGGTRTAIMVGLATWALAYLGPAMNRSLEGIASWSAFWTVALWTAIAVPLATMVGAKVYGPGVARHVAGASADPSAGSDV